MTDNKDNSRDEENSIFNTGRRGYLKSAGGIAGLPIIGGGSVIADPVDKNNNTKRDRIKPRNLEVEYESNPNNVPAEGDSPLRFTWELASNTRNVTQSAYRILIGTTATALDNGQPDVWDSGKVTSSRSTTVEIDELELEADTTYYWKVRVWDGEDTPSLWSSLAEFATALPEAQWNADWIQATLPDQGESPFSRQGVLPLLRSQFDIEAGIQKARVHISAPGFYELYLNGERVGDRVLDQARANYQESVLYSTYDVTEYITSGDNAAGVALGHGRPGEHDERVDVAWESHDPVVRMQLNVTFEDGSETAIVTDETWRATDGPTRWDSLLPAQEFYDARQEQPGWTTTGFDDADWQSVSTTNGPPGDLTPQRVQPRTILDVIDPVDMWEPEPDVYVFDLGQMISGWPELTVEGKEGTQVTLREGEQLSDDGTVEKIDYAAETLWQEYILNGDGVETWEPRFTYGGFRYIQIEGYPGEPSLETVRGKVIHTAVDAGETGTFESSNELLNQIHENTRWGVLNALHGHHTDSPTWEKLGWTEHNLEMAETMSSNFSMARFWEKFLRDCRDSQEENGNIPYVVPHEGEVFSGWPPADANDPGWDAATLICAWHAFEYTGDRHLLEDHYQSMKEYVRFIQRNADNGLIVRTGLGDWNAPGHPGVPPEGPEIVSTAIYYRCVELLSRIADLLGKPSDADHLDSLREDIAHTFNAEFYDPEQAIYATGEVDEYRQTSNLYPLAFDIVQESHREAVAENLANDVRITNDGHLNTGAHGLRHLFPVLSEHGYHDLAYTVATQETYPSWGYWLKNDITALLEDWSLDARSRTHGFLGSVDEWFYQYLAGIRRPVEPGFKHTKIAPEPVGDLEQVKGSIETVRGTITSAWELTASGMELDVSIPGNTTATVSIPRRGNQKVRLRENGKPVWNNGKRTRPNHSGLQTITQDGDRMVLEVGSGEYNFQLEPIGGGREQ